MNHVDRKHFEDLSYYKRGDSRARLEGPAEKAKALREAGTSGGPMVHVIDDDEPFVTAICRLLTASGFNVRSYANAGDFLLAKIPDMPGCILMDVCLPGPSGLELQAALASRPTPLPIVFLSGCSDVPTSVRAMKGGAVDFLTKPVERETLLEAVKRAMARSVNNRALRDRLCEQRACFERLTKRELEVFERVVAGKMNKEIADELGAAERTVKAHRAQVMQKMRVASVAELVHIADQLQWSQNAGINMSV